MSVGVISSSSVAAAAYGSARPAAEQATERATAAPGETRTIADHVAAADGQEPIRSGSATVGTLVDTYL